VSRLDDLPDEAIPLGTTMIIAGAACARRESLAGQRRCNRDLMIRVYEEILKDGHSPPTALRRAQLWLRDLSETAEAAFLSKHPWLAAEFRRRAERRELPGQRTSPRADSHGGSGI